MGGLETRVVLRGIAAVVSALAVIWLALWYFIPAPPTQITMTAGVKGGAFDHLAELYRRKLAAHHVMLNLVYYKVANENVRLIDDPKSGVSAAFLFTLRHQRHMSAFGGKADVAIRARNVRL